MCMHGPEINASVCPLIQMTLVGVSLSLEKHLVSLSDCRFVCVWERDSRFHVVSLQDGLDRQVAHAWVFGEVALGPELVLQHLGKVPDILPWCSLERNGTQRWLCSLHGSEAQKQTHTHTQLLEHAVHLFQALLPLFTLLASEGKALIVRSECVITVTRTRKQIYDSQPGLQRLYFSLGPVLKMAQFNPLFTLDVRKYAHSFRFTATPEDRLFINGLLCDLAVEWLLYQRLSTIQKNCIPFLVQQFLVLHWS